MGETRDSGTECKHPVFLWAGCEPVGRVRPPSGRNRPVRKNPVHKFPRSRPPERKRLEFEAGFESVYRFFAPPPPPNPAPTGGRGAGPHPAGGGPPRKEPGSDSLAARTGLA